MRNFNVLGIKNHRPAAVRGARAGCAPPPGSASDVQSEKYPRCIDLYILSVRMFLTLFYYVKFVKYMFSTYVTNIIAQYFVFVVENDKEKQNIINNGHSYQHVCMVIASYFHYSSANTAGVGSDPRYGRVYRMHCCTRRPFTRRAVQLDWDVYHYWASNW